MTLWWNENDGGGATRFRRLAVVAMFLIALGCTIGTLVPAGLGWDFANFYDAGHRVAAGQVDDLYHPERPIAGQAAQGRMRFWSAPLFAVVLAPLSWLPPATALIAFKLQNCIVLFIALALLYRECRRSIDDDGPLQRAAFAAIFAFGCLLYQPFWTIFRVGGQTTPTVFLLLVLALLFYMRSHLQISAWLLVLAAMIKPALATALLFLACVGGLAFAGSLAVALTFWGLLSTAILGWPIHQEFVHVLIEGAQFSRSWLYNSSLYVPLENLRLRGDFVTPSSAYLLVGLEWILRILVAAR